MKLREKVDRFGSNKKFRDGCPILNAKVELSAESDIALYADNFFFDCLFLPSNPPDIVTTAKQTLWVEGWKVSTRDILFQALSASSQENNVSNLCPSLVHP